jgi:sulfate/thiosulfate transport system ATP-binding protein
MGIEVRNITKTFGTFTALRDVSLSVATGELVALLGPSGSGKTTLLRIIAGLEEPDRGSGAILFHEQDVARRQVGSRQVGFVFQHYALFRHMTVFENVAFGLRVRPKASRPGRNLIKFKVLRLLKLVQLESMANRYPHQLSGGQRQRVALARALAIEPKVLLLDEPFGALDARVRQELRQWLRRLHDEIHLTSVFVTHDQEEALELADRVLVMNEGRIEQIGTPDEVFHKPATEFVVNFLGQVNVFRGRLEGGKVHFSTLAWESPEHAGTPTQPARVFIRPHELSVDVTRNGHPALQATVTRIHSAGPNVRLELLAESGERLCAEVTQERYRSLNIANGATVYVTPRDVKVFADKAKSV